MVDLKWKIGLALLGLCTVVIFTEAQIPALGACPLYSPIAKFNRTRFLGTWFEVERYFTVNEVAMKCVSATYELQVDGKIVVKNALTNSFNNVERIISGIMAPPGRAGDGRYTILYQSFPISYNASVMVLGTDYDSYAVLWSCSNIGPVGHTISAWLLTRDRVPQADVMFRAYEVLKKYGVSRTFFVKTNQVDCVIVPDPVNATEQLVATRQDCGTDGSPQRTGVHQYYQLAATRLEPPVFSLDDLAQFRKEIFAMPNVDVQPLTPEDN
ncbi:apolipoprotein D-like [Sabethes cyaneus]|uniref:apolipoprotein D-like n=1 Tax=Sabethes cyaneus TaxID=53552 RepID=UPI00237E951F|nr:apolipoprotein D-like [Sabethes cyaneus]